jgi:hypothetical protein
MAVAEASPRPVVRCTKVEQIFISQVPLPVSRETSKGVVSAAKLINVAASRCPA